MAQKTVFDKNNWNTVIIGAGQAGLATGYYLKRAEQDFIILDKNKNAGESWSERWDSLRLFTPSHHDSLPGMPFPGPRGELPGKDQMAGYLSAYASLFSLPVQYNVNVDHVSSYDNKFELSFSDGKLTADKVVVATGTHPYPRIPAFASGLKADIFQIHSSLYRNPALLPGGNVLVVGAGTSGLEIALEVSRTHKTYISGKPTFHIPDNVFRFAGELYWWFASNILTVKTPVGRKARKHIINGGGPLIKISAGDLKAAGVVPVPRITGVNGGLPQSEDGNTFEVSSIIWATGYRPDFSWIKLDMQDTSGWPVTNRGVSTSCKGLYFNGMPFQYGLTSGLVGGVGRNAKYISDHILRH